MICVQKLISWYLTWSLGGTRRLCIFSNTCRASL